MRLAYLGICLGILVLFNTTTVLGQIDLLRGLKKPTKFDNRILTAEKTEEKKNTIVRKFFQNNYSHFNYYFNANTKLNNLIAQQTQIGNENYLDLLPFYPYDVKKIAVNTTELDSIIYKCTAGILLHDLRTNWVDDLLFLMGKAYYFSEKPDSAYICFQYINATYGPKTKEGDYTSIGIADEQDGLVHLSDKDKRNWIQKAISNDPIRNQALLWMARCFIYQQKFDQAQSLLSLLAKDTRWPKDLQPALHQQLANLYYHTNEPFLAAQSLEKALPSAENKAEETRWEFLLGQLYGIAKEGKLAATYFQRAQKGTFNPNMEIYAILNQYRYGPPLNEADKIAALETLRKMGRQEKFAKQRMLILYVAGLVEQENNNLAGAIQLYLQAVQQEKPANDPNLIDRIFSALGDDYFALKDYVSSYKWFDSVTNSNLQPLYNEVQEKKSRLAFTAQNLQAIQQQDSLLRIAALPTTERDALLAAYIKEQKRLKGIKDGPKPLAINSADPNNAGRKAEWYFYNTALKQQGYNQFIQTWGNRPNVDNWRRQSALDRLANVPGESLQNPTNSKAVTGSELTIENLSKTLPIDAEQQAEAKAQIGESLANAAGGLMDQLLVWQEAIPFLERYIKEFPKGPREEEVIFRLQYCYNKIGKLQDAKYLQNVLAKDYPKGQWANRLIGDNLSGAEPKEPTQLYESIYDKFIAGEFKEAANMKATADARYGNHYWSPQLLYVEAVALIQQRADSVATSKLQYIVQNFPSSNMVPKVQQLLEVLGRRKDIEAYLSALQIERKENEVILLNDKPNQMATKQVPVAAKVEKPITSQPIEKPLLEKKTAATPTPKAADIAEIAKKPEAKKLNNEAIIQPKLPVIVGGYLAAPHQPHQVLIYLSQVDAVWIGEVKNAFNRFHKEFFPNQNLTIDRGSFSNGVELLVISSFADESAVMNYYDKIKPRIGTEIIPWLKADKYQFIPIAQPNLAQLLERKDWDKYLQFLKSQYPEKF